MSLIDTGKIAEAGQQAAERAIKIHDALDIPYVTCKDDQPVIMSHGQVLEIIQFNHADHQTDKQPSD